MTKYILHGGDIRGSKASGKSFFEAIVKDLDPQPTILMCFFAQPETRWPELFKEWTERISKTLALKPKFEMAFEDNYPDQAKRADALFIYGGDCNLLQDKAKNTKGFIESLSKIKVVAGSSAGAILLSQKSWCCDDRDVNTGLGITPLNCMVHYKSSSYAKNDSRGPIDWEAAEKDLQTAIGKNAKVTRLAEGEFVVLEK